MNSRKKRHESLLEGIKEEGIFEESRCSISWSPLEIKNFYNWKALKEFGRLN